MFQNGAFMLLLTNNKIVLNNECVGYTSGWLAVASCCQKHLKTEMENFKKTQENLRGVKWLPKGI